MHVLLFKTVCGCQGHLNINHIYVPMNATCDAILQKCFSCAAKMNGWARWNLFEKNLVCVKAPNL